MTSPIPDSNTPFFFSFHFNNLNFNFFFPLFIFLYSPTQAKPFFTLFHFSEFLSTLSLFLIRSLSLTLFCSLSDIICSSPVALIIICSSPIALIRSGEFFALSFTYSLSLSLLSLTLFCSLSDIICYSLNHIDHNLFFSESKFLFRNY